MRKVLIFGATGQLGRAIVKEAADRGYDLTIVARSREKAISLFGATIPFKIADVTKPASIDGITDGFDVVISALGKSVSPFDRSKPSFSDIDLLGNELILEDAIKHGVKKIVYISAFHAEEYLHLEYFRVHHEFSQMLIHSGIDYTILRPPALFSAFLDMIGLAKKGQLVNIGSGMKKTNPIYEGDLAKLCMDSIDTSRVVIDAGGKNVYTRRELNEIVQRIIDPERQIWQMPIGLVKIMLPVLRVFDRNSYDKLSFFTAVMEDDVLAPPVGEMKFEEYILARKDH
jgi:uncharacterized protein YbjT (DUF2867 family)